MAMFPCSEGNHRYQGPQQSAYLGATNGGRNERVKKRLCTPHLAATVDWADELLQEIDVNAPPSPDFNGTSRTCFRCKADGAEWMLYVNVYPLKAEPRVWFGSSCAKDVHEFLAEMGLVP